MPTSKKPSQGVPDTPFILGVGDERILDAVARYAYLTATQVTRLLYSRGSLGHVQAKLKRLTEAGYLQRLYLPRPSQMGKAPSVYTLARRGRTYITGAGTELALRFHPSEQRELSYLFLSHTLAVNDVLIGAATLRHAVPAAVLHQFLHERALKRRPVRVTITEGDDHHQATVAVVPDAWLDFHLTDDAGDRRRRCLVLELDRGTTDQKRWRHKVRALLAYAKGPYAQAFETTSITIAVLATPGAKRAADLRTWTQAELATLGEQREADLFRFTGLAPDASPTELFLGPHWRRPFDPQPLPLIEGVSAPGP